MADKKPKPKKPGNYAKLSQRQKFIAAARAGEADESGETFGKTLKKLVPPRHQKRLDRKTPGTLE
jgi:hypothetical protein